MTPASTLVEQKLDPDALRQRIRDIVDVMQSHAGAIELIDVSESGDVTIKFTGMCQGCRFRPMTLYGLIVPALREIPGIGRIDVRGLRLSDEAVQRMTTAFAPA
jgi:Fe-S cluster biogenesis protein NfuA